MGNWKANFSLKKAPAANVKDCGYYYKLQIRLNQRQFVKIHNLSDIYKVSMNEIIRAFIDKAK